MTNNPPTIDTDRQGKRPSLADLVAEPSGPAGAGSLSTDAWIKVLLLGALLAAMNYEQFFLMVASWRHDPNWSHGFIIPLFSLYLLYSRRNELVAAPRRTCLWGLPLLIAAVIFQVLTIYPLQVPYLTQLNMTVIALALVLLVAGPRIVVLTWLPIAYMAFAMPIPERIYTDIAYPLQELAAQSSMWVLHAFGVKIENVASNLQIISMGGLPYGVTVVEACSGVRSLMAFMALGVAMAYLSERPLWQRIIYVLSVIPIAIFCNILRVTITCEMYVIDKPDLGKDFMHEFTGMAMLIPALVMFWLVGKLLSNLFVEVEEDEPSAEAAP